MQTEAKKVRGAMSRAVRVRFLAESLPDSFPCIYTQKSALLFQQI
jgi:hypothetical protein